MEEEPGRAKEILAPVEFHTASKISLFNLPSWLLALHHRTPDALGSLEVGFRRCWMLGLCAIDAGSVRWCTWGYVRWMR